ncbi:MAG: HAMP domain-containing histidine kinase [Bacteroidetes bacterium]|jgi:signal transduction histidine kinase|nr:HAMP domain-containing histidine kinase [Bacteroidota bacterium]
MNIRNRISLYFSLTTILVSGVGFLLIYLLFSANREEEFQMRQKQKVQMTLEMLAQVKQADGKLIEEIDMLTIHDMYDEKLLLFNGNKVLIYSSIDDVPIHFPERILAQLTPENRWVEAKDGLYDVVGAYLMYKGKSFYGISKAYDKFGYKKLQFLGLILIITFISIVLVVIVTSFYLSKKITERLSTVTRKITEYNFEENYTPIEITYSRDEVSLLTQQFNKLMKRMNEVFSFQKHAVHHISHELKTPISILVSNFEKIESETDLTKIKALIQVQKEDTKSLSEIINALLEIAKTESGTTLKQNKIRIDELIFDVAEELKKIYPAFQFLIDYATHTESENQLTIFANKRLIKSVLMNLMQNAILYSTENKSKVLIGANEKSIQLIFENSGTPISENEIHYLFQHFFRGENSVGKRGFGLGLVLVHKIITLHNGTISYQANDQQNTFLITIPLS